MSLSPSEKSQKERVWEWLLQRWGDMRSLRLPPGLFPPAWAYTTWAPVSFAAAPSTLDDVFRSEGSGNEEVGARSSGMSLMYLMRAAKTGRLSQVDQVFRRRFGTFWKPRWSQNQRSVNGSSRVNRRDEFGGTPLMAACVMGVAEAVRLLLQHGAQVDAEDNDGYTPLWCAAFLGEVACLQILVQFGAVINQDCGPSSPLHAAVCSGNVQCVRLLLRAGANVDSTHNTHLSRTPLHAACSSQLLQHVGYYEGLFLSPQKIQAAFDIIQILLNAGAKVNATDRDGNTPLHCLMQHMSSVLLMEGILLLVSHGANCSLQNNHGCTPRLIRKYCLSQRLSRYLQHLEENWPLLPLQFLCYLAIRKALGPRDLESKAASLQLPRKLQKGVLQPLQIFAHDGIQLI